MSDSEHFWLAMAVSFGMDAKAHHAEHGFSKAFWTLGSAAAVIVALVFLIHGFVT
jgi:hypothetical protein